MNNLDEKNKKTVGAMKVRRFIAYVVLILVSIMCLFWFYVLFINATRTHSQIQLGFSPIPGTNFLTNWKNLMEGSQPVWSGLFNSVFIAAAAAALSVYFSAMTAYAIHAYDFKLKNFMFTFILMVMMIPNNVVVLGFLQLITKMKLMNNFIPLIVPTIAAPVTFFYMKQYMESTLPMSLIEAARIDGSGEFRTFNSVVIPLMKPAIAVQAIFAFVTSWNNYFIPSLVITDAKKQTLPIIIAMLRSADWLKFDMGQVYITIAFAILPVVIVYLFLSKHIIAGVTLGGVKG